MRVGWETKSLQELAAPGKSAMSTGPFGSAVSAKNFRESGVPLLRGGNLSEDVGVRLDESDLVFIDAELADGFSRSSVKSGDLVFTCWGTVGQVGLIDATSQFNTYVVSNKQMKMTPDPGVVDPLFLYYQLSTPQMIDLVKSQAIGSSVPGFNLGQLKSLRVTVPPRIEQQAIAEVLGALDDKIAANRKLVETADRLADVTFAQSVQRHADLAGGFSGGSSDSTISELAKEGCLTFGDGYRTKRSELADEGFRIIRVADVFGGEIRPVGEDYVSYDHRTTIGVKAAQVGDIVVTTKGTVGRLGVYEESDGDAVYSPQVCFFRVSENDVLDRAYLRRWFSSPAFVSQSSYRKGNTDMADYINLADIGSLKLNLPSIADQRALAAVLGPLDATISTSRVESRALTALRDALLPRLMSGELRVRDAEREVEEVL